MEIYVTITAVSTDDPSSVIFKFFLLWRNLSRYSYTENNWEPCVVLLQLPLLYEQAGDGLTTQTQQCFGFVWLRFLPASSRSSEILNMEHRTAA